MPTLLILTSELEDYRSIIEAAALADLQIEIEPSDQCEIVLGESALIEALKQNKFAGAVLDVFEQEPLPKDHPFWRTPNLLMTFHTSAPSLPEDIAKIFIENYMLFNAGKPLKYQVDFERGY